MLSALSPDIRQYFIITGNYWAFTLTDGALRMLVVLHFHQLGYSPLDIALLFLFYEIFGVVTNLVGGWLGARIGLNRTMNIGLALQVVALLMLTVPASMLTVVWVMAAQALSGIAKDLNKMSAKSAVKQLVPADAQGRLFHWVAVLTGSKNALKGVGFFLGGLLLSWLGFVGAVTLMAGALSLVWVASLFFLKGELGKSQSKPKFTQVFSTSRAINILSAARMCLFASRDVWFVVALPVFMGEVLGWNPWQVGAFMAAWVVGYGVIQSVAPWINRMISYNRKRGLAEKLPDGKAAVFWGVLLTVAASIPAVVLGQLGTDLSNQLALVSMVIITALLVFGALFAINSSVHSYLIVSYAREDGASLDVGFYYMANAMGRLLGTVLSGWVYQVWGLGACLWVSSGLLVLTVVISFALPQNNKEVVN